VTAVQQRVGQDIHLQSASMRDLLHRLIVWDEQHMERVPPEEQEAVRDDIEQRREWVRQIMKIEETVNQ
jgi:hypothetical protein